MAGGQKVRVLRAEAAKLRGDVLFRSPRHAQEVLIRILRSRWWRLRYPALAFVEVRWGRDSGVRASGDGDPPRLVLGRAQRRLKLLLHETAHLISQVRGLEEPEHGPRFAAIYLQLVRRFIGIEAYRELRRRFRYYSVSIARFGR